MLTATASNIEILATDLNGRGQAIGALRKVTHGAVPCRGGSINARLNGDSLLLSRRRRRLGFVDRWHEVRNLQDLARNLPRRLVEVGFLGNSRSGAEGRRVERVGWVREVVVVHDRAEP